MKTNDLERTIGALMAPGKGILAADESYATIAKRFERLAIAPTEENRRRYRQVLFTAPGMAEYVSGVFLFDETLQQQADDGRWFVKVLVESGMRRSMPAAVPGIVFLSVGQEAQAAQRAFPHRARCNGAAREGRYTPALEQATDAPSGVRLT